MAAGTACGKEKELFLSASCRLALGSQWMVAHSVHTALWAEFLRVWTLTTYLRMNFLRPHLRLWESEAARLGPGNLRFK